MSAIEERFRQLHPTSEGLAAQARQLFPDGVTHVSRKLAPYPVYMDRGKGPRKWDIDGNEYVDYRTGHGSMILGQAHPAIVDAVQTQMAKGTHLSACTEVEIRWASLIKQIVPSVEKVRFVSSGTEAVMMAFRICRRFTGKEKIVKFADAFHGWSDAAYVTDPDTDAAYGIPSGTASSVINLPPHDLEAVENTLKSDDDIAAVVFQGNDVARPEFIRGLRELTERMGVLLMIDEVVSGFRWSMSGCQGRFGVTPDVSAFAKILAGGLPGGAVGGRADILDVIGQGGVRHPGTFNANPLSAAAGATALQLLIEEPVVETAEASAEKLRVGFNEVLQRMEIPGGAYGVASVVSVSLGQEVDTTDPYSTPAEADPGGKRVSGDTLDQLQMEFINQGVWSSPVAFILSSTHQDGDIDFTVDKFEAALREVRKTGAI